MITIELPWAAWYGDGRGHSVSLPDGWDIEICSMQGGTDIGDDGISQRLDARLFGDGHLSHHVVVLHLRHDVNSR